MFCTIRCSFAMFILGLTLFLLLLVVKISDSDAVTSLGEVFNIHTVSRLSSITIKIIRYNVFDHHQTLNNHYNILFVENWRYKDVILLLAVTGQLFSNYGFCLWNDDHLLLRLRRFFSK